jgi:hypothetical protein
MSSTSDARRRPRWTVVAALLGVMAAVSAFGPCAIAEASSQERGFALPSWQANGLDGPDVEQSVREVRAVGATWVQFTPTWYQQNRNASQVAPTHKTVRDSGLERAIGIAHGAGLKVLLKPHIDLPVPGQDSRNNILPGDRKSWFESYTGFITHYAAIAQRLGVEQFAMGTELSSLSNDRASWLPVIRAVRDAYRGTVLYAAGRDYETAAFWDQLDLIGVDAYLPLSDRPTSDVDALKRGWQPAVDGLGALAAQYDRGVVFTEAGFTSQRGTVTDPSNWRVSGVIDPVEQAAAYEALLATFTPLPWWQGVFWWVWITPPYTESEPQDFSPKGKPAEEVIRRWWAT